MQTTDNKLITILYSDFKQSDIPLPEITDDIKNSLPKTYNKQLIDKWNAGINPFTNRKIMKDGRVWRKIESKIEAEIITAKWCKNPEKYYKMKCDELRFKEFCKIRHDVDTLKCGEEKQIYGLKIINNLRSCLDDPKMCMNCKKSNTQEVIGRECSTCRNWHGCNQDCTKTDLIKCFDCGTIQSSKYI